MLPISDAASLHVYQVGFTLQSNELHPIPPVAPAVKPVGTSDDLDDEDDGDDAELFATEEDDSDGEYHETFAVLNTPNLADALVKIKATLDARHVGSVVEIISISKDSNFTVIV